MRRRPVLQGLRLRLAQSYWPAFDSTRSYRNARLRRCASSPCPTGSSASSCPVLLACHRFVPVLPECSSPPIRLVSLSYRVLGFVLPCPTGLLLIHRLRFAQSYSKLGVFFPGAICVVFRPAEESTEITAPCTCLYMCRGVQRISLPSYS